MWNIYGWYLKWTRKNDIIVINISWSEECPKIFENRENMSRRASSINLNISNCFTFRLARIKYLFNEPGLLMCYRKLENTDYQSDNEPIYFDNYGNLYSPQYSSSLEPSQTPWGSRIETVFRCYKAKNLRQFTFDIGWREATKPRKNGALKTNDRK